ncbi:MAG: hypothetical protein J6P74_02310 [Paludibacteraceae bacterium]|nr:hypothetical protein [Paludibacteraceae bacterium]
MKKFILMAAVLTVSVVAGAKNWRINYDENSGADFKTLKAACESAEVMKGDVLYMEPGFHYGSEADNTITKSGLKIVGPGWGFKTNAGEAMEIVTTHFLSAISISADSVHLVGINLERRRILLDKTSSQSNPQKSVTIERCRCYTIYAQKSYFSNLIIRNNFIDDGLSINAGSSNGCSVNQSLIEGNIILGASSIGYESIGSRFDHNTLIGGSGSNKLINSGNGGFQITNNILINKANSTYVFNDYDATVVHNNVFSITQAAYEADAASSYPTYSKYSADQCVGATEANTFVNKTTGEYFDEAMRYFVQEGNVAKTADVNGGECGAFGGAHPYVLNGRPVGIPYLYDVDVPAQPTDNQLTITFKVAGQNE